MRNGGNIKVEIYTSNNIDNTKLKYAVIFAKYKDKWIYVKYKERNTWEVPGGRREENEDIFDTAKRELYEEAGAVKYLIKPLFYYSVENDEIKNYGKVYYALIEELGKLPEMEIEKIELFEKMPINLTYPNIIPLLEKEVINLI